ncbi:MAG: SBBP repeat-containing protein [Candidatus Binataceae bacterium]
MACRNDDAFIAKLSVDGSLLLYSSYLGGSCSASGQGTAADALAVDSSGLVYIVGATASVDFPVTAGAFQSAKADPDSQDDNAFVAKFDMSRSGVESLLYSTYLGGGGSTNIGGPGLGGDAEYAAAIAIGRGGNAYVVGPSFSITNDSCSGDGSPQPCCTGFETGSCIGFPITPHAFQTINNAASVGGSNLFVAELNAMGTALVYSTYLGGSTGDAGYGIAVDSSGNAYITGITYSSDFPATLGAFQTVNNAAGNGGSNAFVTKLDMRPITGGIFVAPRQQSFGRKKIGSQTEKSFTVQAGLSNDSAISIEALNVNSASGDYAFDTAASTCKAGELLAAGQNCTAVVDFTPSSVTKGTSDYGTLTVVSDARAAKPHGGVVRLKGGGRATGRERYRL